MANAKVWWERRRVLDNQVYIYSKAVMTHYDQPLPCRPPGTKFSRDQVWRDLGEDVGKCDYGDVNIRSLSMQRLFVGSMRVVR